MTDPAICPKCKSHNIVPNLWNAGQDLCTNCGYTDQVVLFHREARENIVLLKLPIKETVTTKPKYWWLDRD